MLQEIAKGGGGGVTSVVNLDIHAIAELKEKAIPFTDDSPKYCYTSDHEGNYSKLDWGQDSSKYQLKNNSNLGVLSLGSRQFKTAGQGRSIATWGF